ncbi:MAG: biotin/lipoyl-containing protein [Desulfurococcaceae archaeon]
MPKLYRVRSSLGVDIELEILERSKDTLVFKDTRTGSLYKVQIKKANGGKYIINVNGTDHIVYSSEETGVFIDFATPLITEVISETIRGKEKETEEIKEKQKTLDPAVLYSPISGRVLEIKVKPGTTVKLGDTVILMESMKMIIEVKSHLSGIIEEIYVNPGIAVRRGDRLLKVKPS